MKRTNLGCAPCPIARSLDEIGDWWTLLIVRDVFNGAHRFSEFHRELGLAKNVLSARLRKMVADGILEVRAPADGGAHSEYHLTEKGMALRVILVALRQWGEDHLYGDEQATTEAVDKSDGKPIARLHLTTQDGRLLNPRDIVIKKRVSVAESR